ncbi:hypothetical protein ACFXOK_16520 [Streptomyces sp. NPDC059173]|uniref:hypothetical protein n=1 Tax=Streptomyces sp. NPDC059173 TaxID=3346756 RepID=UPI0036A9962B
MKIEVVFRTAGQADAVVGEAEGETFAEMQAELPALLRVLATEIEGRDHAGEVPDAAAHG